MISPETRAEIRRYFYAEHWKIGTIASELGVHPDAVRNAIESERFRSSKPLGASVVDPYIEFIRHTDGGAEKWGHYGREKGAFNDLFWQAQYNGPVFGFQGGSPMRRCWPIPSRIWRYQVMPLDVFRYSCFSVWFGGTA